MEGMNRGLWDGACEPLGHGRGPDAHLGVSFSVEDCTPLEGGETMEEMLARLNRLRCIEHERVKTTVS